MGSGLRCRTAGTLLGAIALGGLVGAAPLGGQQSDTAHVAGQDSTAAGESAYPVAEAYPGLLSRAHVPSREAVAAALARARHSAFHSARIEEQGRRLVYVIWLVESRGQTREVLVDAETGRILANRRVSRPHGGEA